MENNFSSIIEQEHNSLYQTYKRLPIIVDRAEGCRIYSKSGEVYLDFLAGIAVNALGHSHPKIIEAVENQIKKYMHVSNYFYQEPQIELAEKLKKASSLDKVFFSNSGTESIEAAIKLTRKWGVSQKKNEILAFSGGFHGRTYGSLSIMDKPPYKDGMGPYLDGCKVIPHNDIPSLMENINSKTAGIFLEFIQGEGGLSEPSAEFIDTIEELRKVYGFLLIADEIQAGAGRTGKMFGFQHFGVKPDIIAMAKGLGGGLPLGCIIVEEKLSNIWAKGNHGTTFGGNAVACSAGKVVFDELENGLLEKVQENGDYLHNELLRIKDDFSDKVLEVRGRGLMQGLLLNFEASILVAELLKRNVISNSASGYVLRIVPPLIVGKSEIDEFISKVRESLR